MNPINATLLFVGIVFGIVGTACQHQVRSQLKLKDAPASLIPSSKPKADYTVPIATFRILKPQDARVRFG